MKFYALTSILTCAVFLVRRSVEADGVVVGDLPSLFDDDNEEVDFLALIELDPNELMPDPDLPKDSKEVKGQAALAGPFNHENMAETSDHVVAVKQTPEAATSDVGSGHGSADANVTAVTSGNETYGRVVIMRGRKTKGRRWEEKWSHFGLQQYKYEMRRLAQRKRAAERWRELRGNPAAKMRAFCLHANHTSAVHLRRSRTTYMEKKLAKLPADRSKSIKESWVQHREELKKCCHSADEKQKSCVDKVKLDRIERICRAETTLCPFIEYHLGSNAKKAENNFMKCCDVIGADEKIACFREARTEMQKLKHNNLVKRVKRKMKS